MIGWGTATLGNPSMKKCALCKYLYDPTCEMIAPSTAGRLKYKMGVKRPCRLKKNVEMKSSISCSNFECKLQKQDKYQWYDIISLVFLIGEKFYENKYEIFYGTSYSFNMPF